MVAWKMYQHWSSICSMFESDWAVYWAVEAATWTVLIPNPALRLDLW